MTTETVEQAITLTNLISRAETSVRQLKEIKQALKDGHLTFFSNLSSAVNSVANHVDVAPAIDLLVNLVEDHLSNTKQQLADL